MFVISVSVIQVGPDVVCHFSNCYTGRTRRCLSFQYLLYR